MKPRPPNAPRTAYMGVLCVRAGGYSVSSMHQMGCDNHVRWKVSPYSWDEAETLTHQLGLPPAAATVLAARGYGEVEAARAFIDCPNVVPDPYLFDDMNPVVEVILGAVRNGEPVVVHGDYDADGITATALMMLGLRELGLAAESYLPNRFSEGFGLSGRAVESIAGRGAGLLITVDCGVNYPNEVQRARELGLNVIVIDHHEPGPDLPACLLIHPAVGRYPDDRLCGVGLAFKVLHALAVRLHSEPNDRVPARLHKYLDLVATGTIADLAPLLGENRYYVKEGLKLISIGARVGFRELAKTAGCVGEVDSGAVAFRIAPRLNAAGRLADPAPPLELLLTQEERRAREISLQLHELNGERQEVERRILAEAVGRVESLPGLPPILVLAGSDWHEGVVGIVAARLVERYGRPAVLLSVRDGVAKGSGRSISAYDLISGLHACGEWLTVYGGHTMAAGMTLPQDNIDAFRQALESHASCRLTPADLVPTYAADAVLRGQDVNADTALALASLGPFGSGNPRPRLLVPDASICNPEVTRNGGHLRCVVEVDGVKAKAIGFGLGDQARTLAEAGVRRPLGVELRCSEWQGVVRPELVLQAVGGAVSTGEVVGGCGPDCPRRGGRDVGEAADGSPPSLEGPPVDAGSMRVDAYDAPEGQAGSIAPLARVIATGGSVLLLCCSAPHVLRDLRSRLPVGVMPGEESGDEITCFGRGCAAQRQVGFRPGRIVLADWDVATKPKPNDAAGWMSRAWDHVVAVDPPYRLAHATLLRRLAEAGARVHRLYGRREIERTARLLRYVIHPRFAMICLYRAFSRGAVGADAHREAAELAWRQAGLLLSEEEFIRAGVVLAELGINGPVEGRDRIEPSTVSLYAEAEAEYEECSRLCRIL